VRRLLRDKFRLGLFDDPYVDPDAAAEQVGTRSMIERGLRAQRCSIVLLSNDRGLLPLDATARVYLEALDASELPKEAPVVDRLEDADVAIVRLRAPYEPRDGNFVEALFHAGDLTFGADELARLIELMRRVPTVVDIYLDRPAVIPELAEAAAALLADFGATDGALLDVVYGRAKPTGALPFELPSSMDAVRRQLPDVPHDSDDPLFPFGHGLSYGG
jgi:beta-glucosidase